ncbi:methyl-accepting chemotaxis protein [Pseudomonas chlororaphis]|nr:methyl-accepting chemotaxis protein [Pseudomonas chlororaphis]
MIINLRFVHKVLLATSLTLSIVFAVFASFNAYVQKQGIRNSLDASLMEVGKLTAENISYWLDTRIKLIEATTQGLERDSTALTLQTVLEQKIFNDVFDKIYYGSADKQFTIRPNQSLPTGYDPSSRPWYQSASNSGDTIITPPYVFSTSGNLGVTVAAPLIRNHKLEGVLAGDLTLTTLVDIIKSLNIGGLGDALLVDEHGKILVSSKPDEIPKNLQDAFPENTPAIAAGLSDTKRDGRAQIVLFTPIQGLKSVHWYLALSIDAEKAFAPVSRSRNIAIVATIVAVTIIIVVLGLLMKTLLAPLHLLTQAMVSIAEGDGDLTQRLPQHRRDEFGVLANAFNRFIERMHSSMRDVAHSTTSLYAVSRQVLAASTESIQQSDTQALRTNSMATAINELGAASHEIASNAAHASGEVSSAREQAERGRTTLEQALSAMQALSQKIALSCQHIEVLHSKTANIGVILEVIRGISEQTNLLALNAAIEAARAGDAGRGFAVVADEVRSLAQRTQSSAQQIKQMIEALQTGSLDAVKLMEDSQRRSSETMSIAKDAGERLKVITTRISQIDNQNQSIATATEEQSCVVEALNVDVTDINGLIEKGVLNLSSTLEACRALESEALILQKIVLGFKI